MKRKKKIWYLITILLVLFALLTAWSNYEIINGTKNFVFDDVNQLDYCNTALLLGTSKTLKSGQENEFFKNRIEACLKLYRNNKIKYIIVSGDNRQVNYNEPLDMKNALVENGVPADLIYADYAGLRTYDSVIRSKEIFGQQKILIVSQKFHNERAVYIARLNGIEAFAYNAKDVNANKGFKTKIREYLARNKVFIDHFLGIEPKHLGPKITIGEGT